MVRRKLTDAQRGFVPKLRTLGFSFRDIGYMFGVSDVTIYYCMYPEKKSTSMRKYSEHSATVTVVDGKKTIVRNLSKRPRPDRCELCGDRPAKSYHHWDEDDPSVGLWLCFRCHMAAEVMDDFPTLDFTRVYFGLKRKAAEEVAAEREETANKMRASYKRWQDAQQQG